MADGAYAFANVPSTGSITLQHDGYISATIPYSGAAGTTIAPPLVTLQSINTPNPVLTLQGNANLSHPGESTLLQICVDTHCITASADGAYTLANAPITGTVTYSYPHYIGHAMQYTGTAGSILTLADVTLYAGDPNGDDVIDALDAAVVGIAWGSQSGDANWDPRADFNKDNKVDFLDMVIVQIHWGMSGKEIQESQGRRFPSSKTNELITTQISEGRT